MKKRLGVVLVCGLGIAFAGCGSDTGGKPGTKLDAAAEAGTDVAVGTSIMPLPVLDPRGTYGGKTYEEWAGEWLKWIYEYPGPESLAFNTPGAYCGMGQSTTPGDGGTNGQPFFLGIWDSNDLTGGTFTQACNVPAGRMLLFQVTSWASFNIPGCANYTVQDCQDLATATVVPLAGIELEIDGKAYASQTADFTPYLVNCTDFPLTIPNTPTNFFSYYVGCNLSQPPPAGDFYVGGWFILLAPLSPGSHTIHTRMQDSAYASYPAYLYDVTYNLTVAGTSSLGTADGGAPIDAPSSPAQPVNHCTGPASGALIDDMSGSNISLQPPSCGSPGGWTAWSSAPGVLTSPAGDPSVVFTCGSLCQSLYSPLPAGFPGTTASLDAGPVDVGTADGGATGMQAMCIVGQTGSQQYAWSGMTLTFAYSGTRASGTDPAMVLSRSGFTSDPPPALIDASQYSGIEFWLWASPETAAAMSAAFVVQLVDKNQLPGGGVCNPYVTSGNRPCSVASAGISFSTAAASQGAGSLFDADGNELSSLAPGWQIVRTPWSSFLSNPYYGGGNEKSVDPATLAFAQFVIEQDSANGSAIPFDFCVDGLRFYK
ncbi:MAG TPA: hypothetical protein VJ860_18630 [Polyangia bacterium]|jgi:hypothetical protein|nr:hypothetical protein [Polyangia bacterium]